jgi:Glycosyltransferase family 9 (heptosyltransferase)
MSKTIIYIDGGAGRVIAAIPALLKFHRLNPNKDWSVVIPAWDALLWSIPELQDRTYGADTKGLWDNVVQYADLIMTPEPYRLPAYFKQEISLAEAFDREINNTTDHNDLGVPKLIFNKAEEKWAVNTIADIKQQQQKDKTIIIQPFGRGATLDRADIVDSASRSLSADAYVSLTKKLSAKYNMVFFGDPQFQVATDSYTIKLPPQTDLRMWAALIDCADYFVGVDSVGQHMARATDTPGTVIFGSTFPINTSYPDYFQIIEKAGQKKYSPIRITGLDSILADRYNDTMMDFEESEITEMYNKIVADIERKAK